MKVYNYLARNLEQISQIAILVLTFMAVVLTAMGAYYTMKSFKKQSVEIALTGVLEGETVQGRRVLKPVAVGSNSQNLRVTLENDFGEPMVERDVKSGVAFHLATGDYPDGWYSLVIEALGKHNKLLKSHCVRFAMDNTGPCLVVQGLVGGSVVSGLVTLTCTIEGVDEGVDLDMILDERVSIPVGPLDTTKLADGYHSVRVIAQDAVGNESEETVTFVVDNSPPLIRSLGAPETCLVPANGCLTPDIEEANLATANWFVDSSMEPIHTGLELKTSLLSEGEHEIRLVIRDKAGNEKEISEHVRVDKTPPFVMSALPAKRTMYHPSGILFLGAWTFEDTFRTVYMNDTLIKDNLVFLSRFPDVPEISVVAEYMDNAGNKTVQTTSLVLERSLRGTSGFTKHVGSVAALSLLSLALNSSNILSQIGFGSSYGLVLPTWDDFAPGISFLRLPWGLDIYSLSSLGLLGIRFPLTNLMSPSDSVPDPIDRILIDLGGCRRTIEREQLPVEPRPGCLEAWYEQIRSGAWIKVLPLAVDVLELVLSATSGSSEPWETAEVFSVEFRIGIGLSEFHETERYAFVRGYSAGEKGAYQDIEYQVLSDKKVGGLFPVFELSICIGPVPRSFFSPFNEPW